MLLTKLSEVAHRILLNFNFFVNRNCNRMFATTKFQITRIVNDQFRLFTRCKLFERLYLNW
jgi:hypothetical protein